MTTSFRVHFDLSTPEGVRQLTATVRARTPDEARTAVREAHAPRLPIITKVKRLKDAKGHSNG